MVDKASKVIKGSIWMLGLSWYSRILGMASLLILARNLDRYDFGIVAGCFVVQGFFASFSNVNASTYLVRINKISPDDLNAAWTINFFSKGLITLIIIIFSKDAAEFMNIAELELAMKVMSLSAFFIGCQNPAVSISLKKLDFSKIFYIETISKTISSTLSITIALVYQTYWAVIIAEVVYQFFYSVLSFVYIRYKPKFSTKNILKQWNFTKWTLLKGLVSYVKVACDRIIVSRNFSIPQLGMYNFSMESSATILGFLVEPVLRVLYPSLSDYIEKPKEFTDKLNKIVLILSCIYLPIVFGGIYLSHLIVPVVFGEQWSDIEFLFDVFLIMSFATMLNNLYTDVFTLTGEVKKLFVYEVVVAVCVLSALTLASASGVSLENFAVIRMAIAFLIVFALTSCLGFIIPVTVRKLIELCVFPILSSGIMLLAISQFELLFSFQNPVYELISLIAIGIVVYFTSISLTIYVLKSRVSDYDFIYRTFYLKAYDKFKK